MDADAASVKKEIAAVESELRKLENKKLSLSGEMEFFKQKVQESEKELSVLNDKLNSFSDIDLHMSDEAEKIKMQIAECQKEMQGFADKANKAEDEIKQIDSKIGVFKKHLSSLKFTGSAEKPISELKTKTTSSLNSVEKSFRSFGKRIGNTFKSALVFSVLYKGLNELKQRLSAMLSTNQQFTSSLNQVKSNLAVAFQPIYQAALPAINALLNLLVKASAYLAAFTNALFGTSMSSSISAAREMQNAVNAVENGASGASAAERELTAAIKEKQKQVKALQKENKQLQREYEQQKKAVEEQTAVIEKQISSLEKSIDSIQKMEDAANKAAQAQREAIQKSIDLLNEQQEAIQKRSQAEQKAIDSQVKSLQKQQKALQKEYKKQSGKIDNEIEGFEKEIDAIRKLQEEKKKAEKANQKFTAGFDELSTLDSPEEDDPYDTEIEKLQEKINLLQEEKEALSESHDSQRESIQERIDKLQEEKEAIAEKYDLQNEKIQEQIDLLQAQQDAIKDADYSSSIDRYESRIASLREKIDELNASVEENPLIEQNELLIEQLQDEIDLLQEQKDAIQTSSDAAGSFNSSGLEKFKTKLDEIKKKLEDSPLYKWLTDNQEQIKQFATIVGILAGAIGGAYGAFKLFEGILAVLGSPVGKIALIISAISALIVIGGNGEEVINRLKEAFGYFGDALSDFVSGDFKSAKENLTKGFFALGNAGIAAGESICNAFIKAINWIIEKFNSWVSSLPEDSFFRKEVFDGQISYRAQEVSFPRLEVPALASGAVLPPNKPFMAWVGDQKNGTNVEAPLSTIEDALRNVMAEQEFNFNFTADGSLGAFIRMLNLQINRENTRKTAF